MILDNDLYFSTTDSITSSAYSENVIDLGAAGNAGKPLTLIIDVGTVAVTQTGSGTNTFTLRTSATTDGTDLNGTVVDLATSAAIAKANLGIGKRAWTIKVPPGALRYLQVYYTVSETNLTGNYDAYLVEDADVNLGNTTAGMIN